MALEKKWAGKAFGTNIGNLFLILDGEDAALAGILRFNEEGVGLSIFDVVGDFKAPTLNLTGRRQKQAQDSPVGELEITGSLKSKGVIGGDWITPNGSAGTFILYPHDTVEDGNRPQGPEQLHTARHEFGAIEIDREQIIELAENIRRDFPIVVVTINAGTEQSRYLDDFKAFQLSAKKATIAKVYATKPEGTSSNQVVSVEFGPRINFAMAQGENEAWTLGRLETLKRDLKSYERVYATNIVRYGVSINNLMILAAIVFLPSLNLLRDRVVLMAAVLILVMTVNWLHGKYLPFAAIYLQKKPTGIFRRIGPSVASWGISVTASAAAALLAAYLKGWLRLPLSAP